MNADKRIKSIQLMQKWCEAYLKSLGFHKKVLHEAYEYLKQDNYCNEQESYCVRTRINSILEMDRDICILMRKNDILIHSNPENILFIDKNILDFFKIRKNFETKWAKIEASVADLIIFLQSCPE